MIDWDIFKRRRDLDVKIWMQNVGITSYDQMCKVLKSLGVTPPSEKDVEKFLPAVEKVAVAGLAKLQEIIDPELEPPAGIPLAVPGLTLIDDGKKRKTAKKSKKDS